MSTMQISEGHHALHLTPAGEELMGEIGRVAATHDAATLAALGPGEREVLRGLLARMAAEQGLTEGVHPGYRTLPAASGDTPAKAGASEGAAPGLP